MSLNPPCTVEELAETITSEIIANADKGVYLGAVDISGVNRDIVSTTAEALEELGYDVDLSCYYIRINWKGNK